MGAETDRLHEAEVSRGRRVPRGGHCRKTAGSPLSQGASLGALCSLAPPRRARASRPVQDGAELPGGWVAASHTGHTPGHASYFHPRLGVAIVGDALGSSLKPRVKPSGACEVL